MTAPSPAPAAPPRRTASPRGDRGPDSVLRWISTHPQTVDAIVFGTLSVLCWLAGLGFAVVSLLTLTALPTWPLWSAPLFAAGTTVRRWPGPTVLAVAAVALMHVAARDVVVPGDVMTLYTMYMATVHGSERTARLSLLAGIVGALVLAAEASYSSLMVGSTPTVVQFIAGTLFYGTAGCAVVLALWVLARFQRVKHTTAQLALAAREQELHAREQRAALAVADERARIAREMHDVVAHSLSVIIAQADGGRFIAAQQPDRAAEVLARIGETGRSALADMRGLLGVLRDQGDSPRAPQPGLEDLPALLEQTRSTGLAVSADIRGPMADLPRSLQITLYRVVQESLTNVLKHAGPGASARVTLDAGPTEVVLEVRDNGIGAASVSDGRGHGLIGMRQRVALYNGTMWAGPAPGGGFLVRASIPRDSEPPAALPAPAVPALPAHPPRREETP